MEGDGVTAECVVAPPHAASTRTISTALAALDARVAGRRCGG
jgi:hypothetical protein